MAASGSAEEYARDQLRQGVIILLENMGFSNAQESQINRIAEKWRLIYKEYGEKVKLFTEAAGRTQPVVEDVVAAFKTINQRVPLTRDFLRQVKTSSLPALPNFPAPGPTEVDDETHFAAMYGPRPSEREINSRPNHVPDYYPAMHPEWLPNNGVSDVIKSLTAEQKKKKDEVKTQEKKSVPKIPKTESKCDGIVPRFDDMTFDELGFVVEPKEPVKKETFKSDISAATGITSSANLPTLPIVVGLSSAKSSRYPTPAHSPRIVDIDESSQDRFKMSDIVKSRVHSPMHFDRPSSSNSMVHDMKPIKFTTKPEKPKKEKEPKGPPKPKGRPPKKRPEETSTKAKADYIAEQQKRLQMYKENKERQDMVSKQLFEVLAKRAAQNLTASQETARKAAEEAQKQAQAQILLQQQKGLKLTLPKLFSPKSDAITPSDAATPPLGAMVCIPPPVGAEVCLGEVTEDEIPLDYSQQSSLSTQPAANTTLDSTLDSTADSTALRSTQQTPVKEKKKKHKEKDREHSPSHKKHKKMDKDSDEYKEYKRKKKERKQLERELREKEEKEKAEAKAAAAQKPEGERQKLSVKINFAKIHEALKAGNQHKSLSMRPDSAASSSDRPSSSRDDHHSARESGETSQPPLKFKYKPLIDPESSTQAASSSNATPASASTPATADSTERKVVPPLKLGLMHAKPEDTPSSSTPEKEKKKKNKEKKREKKEREKDKERDREKRREEERKFNISREEERARQEHAKQQEAEREKEKIREIERRKEIERREAEKLREERQREADKQREKEKAREKEKRREERRREKEKKKHRAKSPTPPPPPPPPPPPTRKVLSADDDDEDDSSSSEEEEEVWICPFCSVAYTEGANMVCCDQCDDWFHWHCVGLAVEPPSNVPWFCQRCLGKKKHRDLKRPAKRSDSSSSSKKKKKV